MFSNCVNLFKAPKLPAAILAEGCYADMFSHTAIMSAPQLPANYLKARCYERMFQGCENLFESPQLSATKLVGGCYAKMFEGCSNLRNVTMLATDIDVKTGLSDWLSNVSSSGTFTKAKDMTSLPEGSSGIPNGWTVIDKE